MNVCVLVGYLKGIKEGLFYGSRENKAIVDTTVIFLEKNYLINHVPRSKLVLQERYK